MENESAKKFESVYTNKVRAGKRRTYFFDIRQTKGGDYYITLTESTRRFNGEGYERHKIYLYKEDFNRFKAGLNDVISKVKTELMPDYDYEEFEKRQLEWEAKQAEMDKEAEQGAAAETEATKTDEVSKDTTDQDSATDEDAVTDEDSVTW